MLIFEVPHMFLFAFLILFCLYGRLSFFLIDCLKMRVRCPDNVQLAFASIPPYIYKTEDSKITGVFGNVIPDAISFWCKGKTNLTYIEVESGLAGLEKYVVNATADIIFPIPSVSNRRFFIGRPFIPVGRYNWAPDEYKYYFCK